MSFENQYFTGVNMKQISQAHFYGWGHFALMRYPVVIPCKFPGANIAALDDPVTTIVKLEIRTTLQLIQTVIVWLCTDNATYPFGLVDPKARTLLYSQLALFLCLCLSSGCCWNCGKHSTSVKFCMGFMQRSDFTCYFFISVTKLWRVLQVFITRALIFRHWGKL